MSKSAAAALLILVSGARAERQIASLRALRLDDARGPEHDQVCDRIVPGSRASVVRARKYWRKPKDEVVECECFGGEVLVVKKEEHIGLRAGLNSSAAFDPHETDECQYVCVAEAVRVCREAMSKMEAANEWDPEKRPAGTTTERHSYATALRLSGEALRYMAKATIGRATRQVGGGDLSWSDVCADDRYSALASLTAAFVAACDPLPPSDEAQAILLACMGMIDWKIARHWYFRGQFVFALPDRPKRYTAQDYFDDAEEKLTKAAAVLVNPANTHWSHVVEARGALMRLVALLRPKVEAAGGRVCTESKARKTQGILRMS